MKIETVTDLGGLDLSPQESTQHHMCGHTAISSYVSDPSLPERRRKGIVHIVGPGSQSCRPKLLSDPEKVALYDSKVPLLLSKRCSHSLLVLPHEFALFTGQSYVVMLRSKLLLYRPRGLLVQRRSMESMSENIYLYIYPRHHRTRIDSTVHFAGIHGQRPSGIPGLETP
ncbi:hypothetical protein BDQ94DRAFT_139730 [Aspergillus welwitschiae]|uniref:Uncharacterized protein n=1 Tax=Aspergillus welwitschiae TaxID=1341132 RepID=A0A3F3Q8R5_9EURO|nr:hypothetical protein BDQ94DRAFT_139730 [Aspergillus welwitschiae]RDH35525.1 hypothetical protein BDQ94DRAFT_139730 [Aspergillus welwitschiae]